MIKASALSNNMFTSDQPTSMCKDIVATKADRTSSTQPKNLKPRRKARRLSNVKCTIKDEPYQYLSSSGKLCDELRFLSEYSSNERAERRSSFPTEAHPLCEIMQVAIHENGRQEMQPHNLDDCSRRSETSDDLSRSSSVSDDLSRISLWLFLCVVHNILSSGDQTWILIIMGN